jgi:hypothetical protein
MALNDAFIICDVEYLMHALNTPKSTIGQFVSLASIQYPSLGSMEHITLPVDVEVIHEVAEVISNRCPS